MKKRENMAGKLAVMFLIGGMAGLGVTFCRAQAAPPPPAATQVGITITLPRPVGSHMNDSNTAVFSCVRVPFPPAPNKNKPENFSR